MAKRINEQSVSFSELIPKIGAVLPEGVVLNSLSLTGGITDPLQLNVDMLNANLVSVLIRNLVESDLFEAADILSLSPRGASDSEGGGAVYNFNASLTASFTGTADAAKKAAKAEAAKKAAAAAQAEAAGESSQ
jgi:Tfp pilus assembly protein PilN